MNQTKGILRIGTSGIVVPGNKQSFPALFQKGSRLNYYSSLFNTVEINSSFYKIPMATTFEKWSLDVPVGFQFTVKLWRGITHEKQLKINLDDIRKFVTAANNLGDKKGCLLIQFPGSITIDDCAGVERILQKLIAIDTKNEWRKAIEFRDNSWYGNYAFSLLDKYGASVVLQDMPKSKNVEVNAGATFIYCRFHGPAGNYSGSYSNDFLTVYAEKIKAWLNDGKDVYAYFNNTIGNAFENAISLRSMVEE